MAYCEEEDIVKRIKLVDYENLIAVTEDDTVTSEDILEEAIATADSLIDSYLSNRISNLPLESPPKSIVQCSVDIVIYNLHSRIQYIDIPEFVTEKYKACIEWLKALAKGTANLEPNTFEEEDYTGGVDYDTDRQVFGSGTF